MKKKLIVMMTIVAMAAAVFAGCTAPAKDASVEGKWYDEKGVAGTIEFKAEGKCEITVMGLAVEGEYTFDAKEAKGTVTVTVEDQEQSSEFVLKDDKLTMAEVTYTMTEVEQLDVADAVGDLVEGAEDLADAAAGTTGEDLADAADAITDAADAITDAADSGESTGMTGEELMDIADQQAQDAQDAEDATDADATADADADAEDATDAE